MLNIDLMKILYEETDKAIEDMIDKLSKDAKTTQDMAYINGMARAKGVLMKKYEELQNTGE